MPSTGIYRIIAWAATGLLILTAVGPRPVHAAAPAAPPPAAPAAPPAAQPAARSSEWLVMLYQDADDQILEGDIFTDLNEAERVGSTKDVTIVSQFDRYKGGFAGDGDWTTTKRFLVKKDNNLDHIGSQELADLGELDSGSPKTLSDFLIWAIQKYPAKKYALILSDHGAGWMGGWNDNAPKEGSSLSINAIDQALETALQKTKLDRLDFIGFDACLMSQVEALSGVAPYARYAAASEEVEPAMGWAYATILGGLAADPSQSGADLAESIVSSYIVDDVLIQDDAKRAGFIHNTFRGDPKLTPKELGAVLSRNVTLTAVDLQAMPDFMQALNDFVMALTQVDPTAIAKARTYAQSFENIFGESVPASYLDLGNFAKLTAELAQSPELDAALTELQAASKKLILAEKHGSDRPGATGLTIFFPVRELLVGVGTADSMVSYTGYASRFAGASLWDDFLAFHYFNRDINPDQADVRLLDARHGQAADIADYAAPLLADVPDAATAGAAPGVDSELSIAPIVVSSDVVTTGASVLLNTSITGTNVGYIFVEAARYDPESKSYSIEDRDFVLADNTQQVDGVAYPVWTDKDLKDFVFEWSPTVYSLSDGKNEVFALLDPTVYGARGKDTEYDVHGVYTFADSGNKLDAVMTFDGDLNFQSLYGFTEVNGKGAPREITPGKGDKFTVYEEWVETDKDGKEVRKQYEGGTLTFGDKPIAVTAYEGYPGDYSVAITVQDLNGNNISEYANVTVKE